MQPFAPTGIQQSAHRQLATNLKRLELPCLNGLLCLLGELDGPCQADDLTWHALEVDVLQAAGQQALQTRTSASGKLACSAGDKDCWYCCSVRLIIRQHMLVGYWYMCWTFCTATHGCQRASARHCLL